MCIQKFLEIHNHGKNYARMTNVKCVCIQIKPHFKIIFSMNLAQCTGLRGNLCPFRIPLAGLQLSCYCLSPGALAHWTDVLSRCWVSSHFPLESFSYPFRVPSKDQTPKRQWAFCFHTWQPCQGPGSMWYASPSSLPQIGPGPCLLSLTGQLEPSC